MKPRNQVSHSNLFTALCLQILFLFSCAPPEGGFLADSENSESGDIAELSGYIVVANGTSKNIVLLDPEGRFVRQLLVIDRNSGSAPFGMALYGISDLLVTVEGIDAVWKTSLFGGVESQDRFIENTNLSGTMRGITVLDDGDILVSEATSVERFRPSANGDMPARITAGSWPKALQTGGTHLDATSTGGFIHCSTTTDVIRVYDSTGTQSATASSGIAGTTDVTACAQSASGQVAAVFNGTTDTIRVYSDDTLATTVFSFSDLSLLANPVAVAFKANGNLLVIDGTLHTLVEISAAGAFVSATSVPDIVGATSLLVIP